MTTMIKLFECTERDRNVLEEIAFAGGFLDASTIHERHFRDDRTGEACRRRLRRYCAQGFLEPVRAGISYRPGRHGRLPGLFRITAQGVDFLHHLTGEDYPRSPLPCPRPETLQHRLGIGKLYLLTKDACAIHGFDRPRWIHEYTPRQRPPVAAAAKLHERFLLCHSYRDPDGKPITCWPDAASLIRIPWTTSEGKKDRSLVFLWEYDRSTETLKQVKEKVQGYHMFLTRGDVLRFWKDVHEPIVRVFVITPSDERRRNIGEAIKDLPGSSAFRLAACPTLTPASYFLKPLWLNVRGDATPILSGQYIQGSFSNVDVQHENDQ